MNRKNPAPSQGVRKLTLREQAPNCEIIINGPIFDFRDIVRGRRVIDIGCGYGTNRKLVEDVGGEWVGVEPFEGGAHTVVGDAENLPFENESFDVAIMDAVLEHIPDVGKAFKEVARVLKTDGVFIGYSAFMECFHEISYSHLSFKALEHYSAINGMKLEKISGGSGFGIAYHTKVLFYPLPIGFFYQFISHSIRFIFRTKAFCAYFGLRLKRGSTHIEAKETAELYYKVECLRQSFGFSFIIRKK